jgi:hypothetical protein
MGNGSVTPRTCPARGLGIRDVGAVPEGRDRDFRLRIKFDDLVCGNSSLGVLADLLHVIRAFAPAARRDHLGNE